MALKLNKNMMQWISKLKDNDTQFSMLIKFLYKFWLKI